MVNSENKTLSKNRERNEESFGNSRWIVGIEVIIKPIVVRLPLAIVPVQIANIQVAIGVAESYKISSMALRV